MGDIVVTVDENGNVEVKAEGMQGEGCVILVNQIGQLLGQTEHEEHILPDFDMQPVEEVSYARHREQQRRY